MSEHHHRHNGGHHHEERRRVPDWRHVHHHWYFWVGLVLMLVAIGTYVMTQNLSRVPRIHQPPQASRAVTR